MQTITQVHYDYKPNHRYIMIIKQNKRFLTYFNLCSEEHWNIPAFILFRLLYIRHDYQWQLWLFVSFFSFFFGILWLILKNSSYFETANSWKLLVKNGCFLKILDLHIAVQWHMILWVGFRLTIEFLYIPMASFHQCGIKHITKNIIGLQGFFPLCLWVVLWFQQSWFVIIKSTYLWATNLLGHLFLHKSYEIGKVEPTWSSQPSTCPGPSLLSSFMTDTCSKSFLKLLWWRSHNLPGRTVHLLP